MADLPESGLNRRIKESEAVDRECEDLEGEIASLRAAYEQYFMGMERLPPRDQHKSLTQRMQRLKGKFIRQTAQKFRIQNLQTKIATYERLWARTMQEIEDGTYKRDVFRVKRKAQKVVEKPEQIDEVEELPAFDAAPVPSQPEPLAPAVKTPSLPALAALQPLTKTPSLSGVPAVQPLAKTPSLPAVPALQPLTKTPSLSGVPAVQPLTGRRPFQACP